MKLLIVTLPALNHTVACAWNENATEEITCYVVEASETDVRNIPANPGEQYRIPLTSKVTTNLVTALREMIIRGME